MSTASLKIRFEDFGYYFYLLVLFVILGFWPSYFSKFFDGTADFSFYFHFHALTASLWVAALIIQPLLIKKGNYALHRSIGKASYLLMPLIFISVILLAHSTLNPQSESLWLDLWFPFKDLITLGTMYGIAVYHRKKMPIHARGMIVAGMVLIEPALSRFLMAAMGNGMVGYLITLGLMYGILIFLMVMERGQKEGRWVFPLGLGLFLFVHGIIILEIKIGPWAAFTQWFASLGLT